MTVRRLTSFVLALLGLVPSVAAHGVTTAHAAPPAPAAGDHATGRQEYRQLVMGVEARLVLCTDDAEAARLAAAATFDLLEEIEQALSDYRPDSEVTQLVVRAARGPVQVSEVLFDLLLRCDTYWHLSDGAFDPTVGPLVDLWRRARAEGGFPTDTAVVEARQRTGWNHVRLDGTTRQVFLARGGMRFDFGAIGKGYAADLALAELERRGFGASLVEIGGDLVCGDAPPGTDGWVIEAGCDAPRERLVLSRAAVATTGDTSQGWDLPPFRMSHVLDPRTGQPLIDDTCVTVIAPTGTAADALASSVRVLGRQDGRRLVQALPDVEAVIVPPGSRSLFDGRTLDGWVTRGGRYDGDARWSVEDGALTGRVGEGRAGGLIYTAERFGDFEFELEVRIDEPFDSGVFVRMVPDLRGAQVTLDVRDGGEVGGIYSDGWLQHHPDGRAAWEPGAWHHLVVRCTGEDLSLAVWLDGEPFVNYTLPEGSTGFAREGLIGLQVHGGRDDPIDHRAQFRRMRVIELVPSDTVEGHWMPVVERREAAPDDVPGAGPGAGSDVRSDVGSDAGPGHEPAGDGR